VLSRVDGIESSRNDLLGSSPQRFIREAMLEQLGVGENDAQLIVEAVEQTNHFLRNRRIWRPVARQGSVRRHG
jgi:hypothetical protein